MEDPIKHLNKGRKRARTDVQKEDRRDAILGVARACVIESGFEAVTMNELAARAGLAKGTLYLYFRTKEEVFLSLFVDTMRDVVDRFVAQAARKNLAATLTRIALDTPLFLPLYARLVAVIEANVSDEALFAAKRAMHVENTRFVAHLASLLSIKPKIATRLASALMLAMQGAAQFDLTSRRAPDSLPSDLRPIFASHAFAERFEDAARMILTASVN